VLKRENMHLKQYGKKIVRMALEGTKYEPVLTLFTSRNFMVFSQDVQVSKLLKLNRKIPQLILMGKYAR
jgi:large subunit ribosomal protein L10